MCLYDYERIEYYYTSGKLAKLGTLGCLMTLGWRREIKALWRQATQQEQDRMFEIFIGFLCSRRARMHPVIRVYANPNFSLQSIVWS